MKIGYINSCIAGDYRYVSNVSVFLQENGDIIIERHEGGAVGGMDGPGGATSPLAVYRARVPAKNVTPSRVVSEVKKSFDHVIRTYGKPSKNFTWVCGGRESVNGLSAAKVKMVLASR